MSLRFLASMLTVLPLALAGCDRETRDFQGASLQAHSRTVAFGDNAYELARGQRLYAWMNCSGCHSNGGGGMGPPLRDDEWRYGGRMKQMVATIMDGRPNGMPSFRDRITEEQAWQIASYVRSMSARARQDILAGRADKPASVEPPTLDERKSVRKASPLQDDSTQE
jgi:cytochrome c oxidase cbb3-type subunit 3